MRAGNRAAYMSAVKEGEGFATVEDVTVACLGIELGRHDTSVGTSRDGWTGGPTFQRCLGRRTARCSFLWRGQEEAEEEGETSPTARMEVARVRKRRESVAVRRTYDWKRRHRGR